MSAETGTPVQIHETEHDVLKAALELHATHEEPTPREVLSLQIRGICARAGLPKPDFDHFPPSELASSYFESLDRG